MNLSVGKRQASSSVWLSSAGSGQLSRPGPPQIITYGAAGDIATPGAISRLERPQGDILFGAAISNYLSTYDIAVLCEGIIWRLVKFLREGSNQSKAI